MNDETKQRMADQCKRRTHARQYFDERAGHYVDIPRREPTDAELEELARCNVGPNRKARRTAAAKARRTVAAKARKGR